MIPQNELRIGNWTLNSSGRYYKIDAGADIDNAATLSPVPLNDALLTNCGFEFHSYFKLWQNTKERQGNGPELELDNDYNVRDFGHRFIGVQLKSLHQFQNLFFQLKGVELQIDIMETRSVYSKN
jgi:hypothetical protein